MQSFCVECGGGGGGDGYCNDFPFFLGKKCKHHGSQLSDQFVKANQISQKKSK